MNDGWKKPRRRGFWLLPVLCCLAGGCCSLPARATANEPPPHALALIDGRLAPLLEPELGQYLALAERRRRFPIRLEVLTDLDDWPFTKVRELLQTRKAENPLLEGILFIGNIKLPSFFGIRGDTLQTRLLPRYYEDLDLVLDKRREGKHDFDVMSPGPQRFPEVWTAWLPVGQTVDDSYDRFAEQIRPFLQKAIAFYEGDSRPEPRFYQVSNQLWNLERVWAAYGPERIDFYAVNPTDCASPREKMQPPPSIAELYVRTPCEQYASFRDLWRYQRARPTIGEGWQDAEIFSAHLRDAWFECVWINVHSHERGSIIDSAAARKLSPAGLVMLLSGCSVAGFCQPGSPSFVDTGVLPLENLLVAWVYGKSRCQAAFGSPFNRVDESYFEFLVPFLKEGDYLGNAHLKRNILQYRASGNDDVLKGRQEILIGDPFLDLLGPGITANPGPLDPETVPPPGEWDSIVRDRNQAEAGIAAARRECETHQEDREAREAYLDSVQKAIATFEEIEPLSDRIPDLRRLEDEITRDLERMAGGD